MLKTFKNKYEHLPKVPSEATKAQTKTSEVNIDDKLKYIQQKMKNRTIIGHGMKNVWQSVPMCPIGHNVTEMSQLGEM